MFRVHIGYNCAYIYIYGNVHRNSSAFMKQFYYRAMHYSAQRGIAIACRLSVGPSVRLSVCDVGGSGPHRLEIFETNNCTDN